MDYEKLLKKAQGEIPKSSLEKARFEMPKIKGHIQGNRTVLTNFVQIANKLGRDQKQMLKFLLKELATPGEIKKSGSVMLGRKISSNLINEKLNLYAERFVFCKECGKPDTQIKVEGNINFLKCTACGAKHPIK
mgnify:CR=1 FL=1